MKYIILTKMDIGRGWVQYYIEHTVNHVDGHPPWTTTSSTDVLANAKAFNSRKDAEKARHEAYINPVTYNKQPRFTESNIIGLSEKEYFQALLMGRRWKAWIGLI